MKISLIQIESNNNREDNFTKATTYIKEAMKHSPDIICLSESFLYRGADSLEHAETVDSPYIIWFQELAKAHNVNIILWSIALKADNKRVTNSSLILNRSGEIIHRYDKIYMYDVERDDLTYRESDSTQPGTELGFFTLEGVNMWVGICVDVRYPEYFRELTRLGAEIIFLPSNFRKATGLLAWDILTKARAIENQVYFCACGQTGKADNKERCGNTRIISFDGKILSNINEEEGIITADIDLDALRQFRKEFPVLRQMK